MLDSGKIISITQSMLDAYGESGHLVLDEKFTRDELLHFLLLESSNDVAEAFAQTFGHSTSTNEFMEEMNSFAHEIGMQNTFFKDPSGLNPANVSNAKDLFTLSKYLYKSEKDLLEISRKRVLEIATTTDHGSHHLININPYVYYTGFIGGKTGRTDYAKETMVSLFDQEVGDTKYPIVIIILRSEFGQREIDTEKLLDLFIKKVSGGI
jgi:D-alanyl-D-alanine carboxypeptidase